MPSLRRALLTLGLAALVSAAASTQSPNGDTFNASSPYAGLSALDGRPETFPPNGKPPRCVPPISTWKLIAQDSGECYYFAPDPINGYITSKNNVGILQKFFVRCGSNPLDHSTVICQNPGDDLPGARPTTGPPAGSGVSATGRNGEVFSGGSADGGGNAGGNPMTPGGGMSANGGVPGPSGGPRIPGPAGGKGYTPGANPCLPFGPGGYDYCANPSNTRRPPGCSCDNTPATPRLRGGVAMTEPDPAPTPKPKPNQPDVDRLRYAAGFVNGVGNCVQGFVNLIAAAGWVARGAIKSQIVPSTLLTDRDFANASALLGLEPGQSLTLRQVVSEATAPKIQLAQSVDPYIAATSAGQRFCALGVMPGVLKALHGPNPPPKSTPGGSTPSTPTASVPPESTPGTLPGSPNAPPASRPAPPSISLGGSSPSSPIPGPTLVAAVSKTGSAQGLVGTWVKIPGGSVQLGTFMGKGTFGGVFELVKNRAQVIKIPTTTPGSGQSLANQVTGSTRLKQIGVDTPAITESIPGSGNQPPMLIMDNAFDKPGAFQVTPDGYIRTRGTLETGARVPATADVLQQTDAAFHKLHTDIGNGGYIAPDLSPGNVIYYPKPGGGYIASVVDSDMILTKNEFVDTLGGRTGRQLMENATRLSTPAVVAISTLDSGAMLDMLDDLSFTPKSMMDALWTSRQHVIDAARAGAK